MRRCSASPSSVFESVKAHSERRANAKKWRMGTVPNSPEGEKGARARQLTVIASHMLRGLAPFSSELGTVPILHFLKRARDRGSKEIERQSCARCARHDCPLLLGNGDCPHYTVTGRPFLMES